MTLRAVLAAQGNLKGQGMARRPMPSLFNFPVLARAAFAGLLTNWEYRGGYRFPTRHTKPCLQPTSQAGLFVHHVQVGKRYPPLYSQYFGLGL